MGLIYDALRDHLLAGRTFIGVEDVAAEFGTSRAEQTTELARYAGVTRRTVERWRTSGAQRRNFARSKHAAALRTEARRRILQRSRGDVRRNGIAMRIGASIRVSRLMRYHIMPAPAGNRPRYTHITGQAMRPVLDALPADITSPEEDDIANVEDELLRAFFAAYWQGNEDPGQIGAIDMAEIRT